MTDHRSILAIHPGALGDVILLGHLLRSLGGEVCLVAGGEKARLLAGAGVVGAAMDFDSLPMHEVFTDAAPATCRLRDLLGPRERLISCFGGGDERAERRLAELCGAGEAVFLPVRPPAEFDGHLIEFWWRAVAAEWVDVAERPGPLPPPSWSIPSPWRREAAKALGRVGIAPGRPYLAIHPGAGVPEKCWALERFVELAETLRGRGAAVVFLLGAVELDRWHGGAVERLAGRFPTLVDEPLSTVAGVLAGAGSFVGNDSGVSHLAAAVGAPTVALFGPTSPVHFSPLGPRVRIIAAETMERIDPRDVLRAVGLP